MKTEDAINKRTSVREFSNKPVKFEIIMNAIESANQAPFAGNINNLKFIIIEKKENKNSIAEFSQQYWVLDAQWIVVVCSEYKKLERLYHERAEIYARQQAGAAIENMLLNLSSNNLGACWVGAFAEHEIKVRLKIPKEWNIEAIIPIGYPKLRAIRKKRKLDIENNIFWEKWNESSKPRKYPHKDPDTN